jgi:hypothetical protein
MGILRYAFRPDGETFLLSPDRTDILMSALQFYPGLFTKLFETDQPSLHAFVGLSRIVFTVFTFTVSLFFR